MHVNLGLKYVCSQIHPGIWYFGLFNGIGPLRTQSKMVLAQTYLYSMFWPIPFGLLSIDISM